MNFTEIRQKYPDYNDMSDSDFAQSFHEKFYSDLSFDDFSAKVGYKTEKQPSLLDKAIGAGEAALNTGTALTTGTLAGAVGGLQGIIDSVAGGTFGTQEGVAQSGKKFHDYAEMATYSPRTEKGKEYSENVGKVISEQAPALVGAMPQLEALARLGKPALLQMGENAKATPEVRSNKNAAMEAILAEDAKKAAQEPPQPQQMPQQMVEGAQMDLFRETPEQILARQKEQAAAESQGILRDAQGEQGDLFLGQGKEPMERIVPEDSHPAEIEAAYAQRDAQRQADFDLAAERQAAQQEPLTLEPEQGSSNTVGMGQTSAGRGQRGSIGFFGKETQESFTRDMQEAYPQATPEQIKRAWEKQQGTLEQEQVAKAVGKIDPRLESKLDIYKDVSKEDAMAAIAGSPDSEQTSLGAIRNNLLSRGRLGAEIAKNPGVRSGIAFLTGLRDKAGITANQVLHGESGILRDLRKQETLFGEGNAGEVLRQRQEAQFNPDYKFNFNREQAKAHQKLDTLFTTIKTEMERLTGKKIHTVPNYFPNMFYGPFAVEVRDPAGRLVAFVTEKTAKEASRAAQQVAGELGTGFSIADPKFRKEITSEGFKNKTGLAPYFEAMLDLLSSDDPTVLKAQESVQRVIAKRAMDTRQMQNRLKFKAGVVGAEGTKTWKSATENYRDAKDVLENYVRGFEEWKANMESAQFLNEVKEKHGASNTYSILQRQLDDVRNAGAAVNGTVADINTAMSNAIGRDVGGGVTRAARTASGVLTKLWLGFYKPEAMAQNILQPIHILPKITELAMSGGSKDVISPIIIGLAQSLKDGFDITANKVLGKDLKERAQYLRDFEVIKPGLVEAENRTKAGHYAEKGVVSGGLLSTEAFARTATFNILANYLKDSGYSKEQAYGLAKNLTHEYQVNYENYAKPGIINNTGVVGELAGRLQSFKINQMTQLANYVDVLRKEKNPVPLATSLAISVGMAGVSGMIGMDIAEGIYGVLVSTGMVEPDTRSPRQMAMDLGGATAVGIPTQATGKWLSGSLTANLVGDMSWRNIAPIFAGVADVGTKLPIAGKLVKDLVTGDQTTSQSERAQLIMAVTPTVARGALEDKFLTDKEGRVASQYTGQVGYVKGEQDKDLLSRFTSVRSQERGEALARKTMLSAQEKRIKTAIDNKVASLQKLVDEDVRGMRELKPDTIAQHLQRVIDLGGDPRQTLQQVKNFTVRNHMGDWFEQQVASGNINLGNVNKKLRAIEEQEKWKGK